MCSSDLLLAGMAPLAMASWLAFGRYGDVLLGPEGEPPEYSTSSWIAMMFTASMGAGLIAWGFAEPVFYIETPPFGIAPHSDLAYEFARARGEPRCLWECGVLPQPPAAHLPPPPPVGVAPGEPLAPCPHRPGAVVYTDASATRPKEPLLRRVACAVWVGPGHGEGWAWPLPGRVQTVYRGELYSLVRAVETLPGRIVVVTDCLGVQREAQRLITGGRLDSAGRHADLWGRFCRAIAPEPGGGGGWAVQSRRPMGTVP